MCEADTDVLVSLVDKSLVRRRVDGRLWMLETIRELAAERLDELERSDELRARHARHFTELAARLGLSMESISAGNAQRYDLALPELDNFRAALDWSERHDPVLGLTLAVSMENLWVTQSLAEGGTRLEALLRAAGDDAPLSLRAGGVRSLGSCSIMTSGDRVGGRDRFLESLELYTRAGDEWGMTVMQHRLGTSAMQLGEWPRARPLLELALSRARQHGIGIVEASTLGSLAHLERHEGNVEQALALALESRDRARAAGFTWWEAGMLETASELSRALHRLGDEARYRRGALALAHRLSDRLSVILSLAELARTAATRGEAERAGRLWGAIEREELRGRLVLWEQERAEFADAVAAVAGEEFERGRAVGLRMSLDEAVEEELGEA